MKFQFLLIAVLSALAFTACEKEEPNCRDNTLAVYQGSDGFGGTIAADVQEGAGEKGTIVVFTFDNPNLGAASSYTLTGELNESCTTMEVPQQTVAQTQTEGTLAITDTKMTGTLTIDGTTYPLNLTKQ